MFIIIGDRIKKIREKHNKTQTELANIIGTTRSVIANIEGNRVSPRNWFIKPFCKEFNINENWLMTGKGEEYEIEFSDYDDKLSTLLIKYIEDENITALSIIEKLNNLSDTSLDLIDKLIEELQKK